MRFKRIFLLIMDSVGVGEARDALEYNDVGSNTLGNIINKTDLFIPNLKNIGFTNTLTTTEEEKEAYYTIARPTNKGKDSLNGHYEIMGISSSVPYKSFNNGFPIEILENIERITSRKVIGNKCANAENIIQELGEKAVNYGALIVFTSADSDLQIAAHEDIIPVSTLYKYCEQIRKLTLREEWLVGRVIARPFTGVNSYRLINSSRKDYAIKPPKRTILDDLSDNKYNVIGIGKVNDIFDKQGINKTIKANSNNEVINKLTDIMDKSFTGLCIANLSDFDSLYGHQRNPIGYAKSLEEFDVNIPIILNKLDTDDLLIITADHGNDPTFDGNNHTRENVPVILYSRSFMNPKRLPIMESMADIGATIADNFDINKPEIGKSFLKSLE